MLIATSMVLFEKYGQDIAYSIGNVKELVTSKSITIIDNTLTSGKTICDTLSSIRKVAKDSDINVVVSVDRMEKNKQSSLTALSVP